MNNANKYLLIFIFLFLITSCGEKWLEGPESKTILLESQVWNDESMIKNLLGDLYNRLPIRSAHSTGISAEQTFAELDEGVATGGMEGSIPTTNNNLINYSYDRWTLWNYNVIRDINLAIESIDEFSISLSDETKAQFKAELRFLRAFNYFEMVKRMGGVPIVTTQLIYDYSGNPDYLQKSRNKEEEVYDFIASELDNIIDDIGNEGSLTRANKYSVLALKCRAMLYAGSLSKYNNLMPVPITLPGNIIGIPASKATGYYQASLDAAKVIIASDKYSLYINNPENLGENFYEALTKKVGNKELIMIVDYNVALGKFHRFSYHEIARPMREGNFSGSGVNPPLNLVEAYEYLDGSPGILKGVGDGTVTGQANWIFYDNISDIFENKDARLYGTIVYPGTTLKKIDVNIQAGVYEWNPSMNRYDRYESSSLGALFTDGKLLTGLGGPMRLEQEVSNTGFYIRKFIDPAAMSSVTNIGSDIAWPIFRYAEVLLNAAEAAFELGFVTEAIGYVNEVRERAGFIPNSLDASTLTIEKLQNERRVELAYEDHRLWDVARWRIAHILWDGSPSTYTANLYALYPYRVINSEDPIKNGKYVFDTFKAPKFLAPRYYRIGNYYSSIPQTVLDNNPLIDKNPFH